MCQPVDDESAHPRKRNLGVRENLIPDLDQSLQLTDFRGIVIGEVVEGEEGYFCVCWLVFLTVSD